jgi:hypothetical protein
VIVEALVVEVLVVPDRVVLRLLRCLGGLDTTGSGRLVHRQVRETREALPDGSVKLLTSVGRGSMVHGRSSWLTKGCAGRRVLEEELSDTRLKSWFLLLDAAASWSVAEDVGARGMRSRRDNSAGRSSRHPVPRRVRRRRRRGLVLGTTASVVGSPNPGPTQAGGFVVLGHDGELPSDGEPRGPRVGVEASEISRGSRVRVRVWR